MGVDNSSVKLKDWHPLPYAFLSKFMGTEICFNAKLKIKEKRRGKILGKMDEKNNPKTDEAFCDHR
jgi:hypothetical protein